MTVVDFTYMPMRFYHLALCNLALACVYIYPEVNTRLCSCNINTQDKTYIEMWQCMSVLLLWRRQRHLTAGVFTLLASGTIIFLPLLSCYLLVVPHE